jgi:hypothetical protein
VAAFIFSLLRAVMVKLAKSLPIVLIPEQRQVATMRLDVIDNCRCSHTSERLAHHTQRMLNKITFARLFPSIGVAASSSATPIVRAHHQAL